MPLTVDKDLVVTLPRKSRKDMKVSVDYNQPVPAPVEKGQPVGKVVVTAPDTRRSKRRWWPAPVSSVWGRRPRRDGRRPSDLGRRH